MPLTFAHASHVLLQHLTHVTAFESCNTELVGAAPVETRDWIENLQMTTQLISPLL